MNFCGGVAQYVAIRILERRSSSASTWALQVSAVHLIESTHGLSLPSGPESVWCVYTKFDGRSLLSADYLVKPLRQNEIRNLWTRVPVLVALFSKVRMHSAVRMLRRYDCQILLFRRRHRSAHESSVHPNVRLTVIYSIAGPCGDTQCQPRFSRGRSFTRSVRKQPN